MESVAFIVARKVSYKYSPAPFAEPASTAPEFFAGKVAFPTLASLEADVVFWWSSVCSFGFAYAISYFHSSSPGTGTRSSSCECPR